MENFRLTNLSILIMINTLSSSDENEARLAERLNHLYNSAILNDKQLDMSTNQSEVNQFWERVCENRQMTFNSKKETKALVGLQNSEKEESKENRKRKNREKEKGHKVNSNTLKEKDEHKHKIAKIKEKGIRNNANNNDDGGTWICRLYGLVRHL